MAEIGKLLVQDGIATAAEVRSALRAQQVSSKRLGELLVERGIVSQPALQRVLARQQSRGPQQVPGFGTGLRAALERARPEQRTLAG